jgi:hypothetical protein
VARLRVASADRLGQRKTPREKFRRGVLSQFMLNFKISPRREG